MSSFCANFNIVAINFFFPSLPVNPLYGFLEFSARFLTVGTQLFTSTQLWAACLHFLFCSLRAGLGDGDQNDGARDKNEGDRDRNDGTGDQKGLRDGARR